MTKKDRQAVYDKFGGRCGYTGKPLDDKWQVDHIEPQAHFRWGLRSGEVNAIDNLLPAIRIVNHYKRCKDLEFFRTYMKNFHTRLAKLPKKTMVAKTEKRKAYMNTIADLFGITVDNPFSGVFYFETINQ